jgi:antitoxin (DNA-binding transcriptional repressor) of toxin-antitoxin stability system
MREAGPDRNRLRALGFGLALCLGCTGSSGGVSAESPKQAADGCRSGNEAPSLEEIGWLRKGDFETGPDVTARFRDLLAEVRAGREVIPSHADRFVYLLVPGLASTYQPTYMNDNLRALTARGLRAEEDPPQHRLRRSERRDQAGRRQDLARQLHAVRPGFLRRGQLPPGQRRKPLRS